jgi:solute carrier family 25 phosphate transporter 3
MLLQGLGSTAAGYLLQGAFKYGLWEVFKSFLGFNSAIGVVRIVVLVVAAFAAELIASTLLCPFERARIKLVSDPSYADGLPKALSRLLQEDGVAKGLFGDGLAPTLVKMTAYTVAQLTTFTLVSEALSGALPADVPRLAFTLPSSVTAGFVASIASQPGDTLQTCTSTKTKLSEQCPVDVASGGPPSLLELALALGAEGLFTGWQARLVQMEVIVVTQLLVYDTIKSLVGL